MPFKQYVDLPSGPAQSDIAFIDHYWTDHWQGTSLLEQAHTLDRDDLWPAIQAFLPPGPVLEGGCGTGQWVYFLGQAGYRALGVEYAESVLRQAVREVPGLPVLPGDVRRLPFRNGAFNGYLSLGVVEHFEGGPQPILREARRVLRPGGRLLISVPYRSLAKRLVFPRQSPGTPGQRFYQYVFRTAEFRRILEACGFRVVAVRYLDRAFGMTSAAGVLRSARTSVLAARRGPLLRARPALRRLWLGGLRLVPRRAVAHMVLFVAEPFP